MLSGHNSGLKVVTLFQYNQNHIIKDNFDNVNLYLMTPQLTLFLR